MRKIAREVAFKVIYQSLFNPNSNLDLEEFLDTEKVIKDDDRSFCKELIKLYTENKQDIDEVIASHLVDFSIDRIYKIDRAILSLAISELNYYKCNPVSVVINEAVEIAKKYGTDKSYKFVNGVLKTLVEGDDVR